MSYEEFEQRLAAYLGDEMDAGERAEFERLCATRSEWQREMEELRAVRTELREAIPDADASETAASWSAARRPAGRAMASWIGIAAAVLFAFSAGYIARGLQQGTPNSASPQLVVQSEPSFGEPQYGEEFVRRFAAASRRQPNATTLSKTWLALVTQ